MTRKRAKELFPIIQAYAEGKTIQIGHAYDWTDIEEPEFRGSPTQGYRIKPEPKLRPWTFNEVPVGAIVRGKIGMWKTIIIGADNSGISTPLLNDSNYYVNFDHALENYNHSTDGGKTWLPCGVETEGE